MATILGRSAAAGPWSIEPRIGVSTDYSTNPLLQSVGAKAEAHIAGLLDFPLRYDGDSVEYMLRSNSRLSNSSGYSSLASNFEHLDADAQFRDERGSTTVQAGWARDSSLYYAGALVNGIGVRRDTASTSVDWTRFLTERSQVQLDASWTQVRYSAPANFTNYLVDYRYLNAGPTFSVAVNERNTIQILGNVGRYQSLDGITESTSENLQLGLVRQLNEIWALSTSGGYSRSTNREKIFYGPFLLGTFQSNQTGTVYAATLTRQGEKLNLSAAVSRALQPTGFAYLSRQDKININASYVRSERWDYAIGGTWVRATNPIPGTNGAISNANTRYLNVQLTANWHWTPQWVVAMHATHVTQQYGPPTISAASTGVGVDLVRQFLRTQF
jgi:hypothetical protein